MTKKTLPTQLSGAVTPFKGNGRQLGYPTANLTANLELADGVYFGFATLAAYTHQPALIFIGAPLTLGDKQRRLEAHLLDIADKDYYGQTLDLQICHFHRPNQEFDSIEELTVAMQADEAAGRAWFKKASLARPANLVDT